MLGDTTGPGTLGEQALWVIRDSLGNYWVSQDQALKVFSSAGVFLREVGRSGGGPMEFQGIPRPVYTDRDGRVHIIDINRRETIVAPDFQLYQERTLPVLIRDAVPLRGGNRYVVNAWVPSSGQIGLPLHIIEGSDVLHSFGVNVPDVVEQSDFLSRRTLARDNRGHILSAKYYDYDIEAWTEQGRRITGFKRAGLNAKEPIAGTISADNPPPNKIFALRPDEAGRLWVIHWRRRPEWLKEMEPRVYEGGQVALDMKGASPYQAMFVCQVDVIDLSTGTVIATRDGPEMFLGFVGGGLVFGLEYDDEGVVRVGIWKVTLSDEPGGTQ